MARPTRLDIEDGWYHVVNRGIERRTIFRGAKAYEHFIALLSKLPQRFGPVSELWGEDWQLLQSGYRNGALTAALYFARSHSDKTSANWGS